MVKIRMSRTERIRIGIVQFKADNDEPGENLEKATSYIESLVEEDVNIVVLPEMFNSGYGTDEATVNNAVEMQEETEEVLSALADYNDIAIVGGMVNRTKVGLFNSAVIMLPYLEAIYYNKTHLFRDEKKVFTPGKEFKSFEYLGVKFGLLMCYEIGFPEISRKLCRQGAEVLLVPFAFGRERRLIYDTATRARSIENGCFLAAASQVGSNKSMNFVGESRIVSPSGEIIADCGGAEGFVFADVDTKLVKRYRFNESRDSHGYFSNLRDDLYV